MVTLPIPLRLLLLIALGSPRVSAIPAASLFPRQDNTCAANDLSRCPRGLPDNFCCPSDNSCIALAGDTTALCCPPGEDCLQIQPIICDIQSQNVDDNLSAPVKTTVFDVELERCGGGDTCCPFGYSCSGSRCRLNEDQSESPRGPPRPTSTSISAAPSATGTATSTQSEPSSTSTNPVVSVVPSEDNGEASGGVSIGPVIGGVVGGCIALALIASIIFYCVRRNRSEPSNTEKAASHSSHSRNHSRNNEGGPFGNIISEPILQPNSYRTDFIRKEPSDRFSFEPTPQIVVSRSSIHNPFDSPELSPHSMAGSVMSNDGPMRTGHVAGARLPPIRSMKGSDRKSHHADPRFVQREPSSESISVFADPGTVPKFSDPRRLTRGTTFTDLMDQADLGDVHRGHRPYVPGATPRI